MFCLDSSCDNLRQWEQYSTNNILSFLIYFLFLSKTFSTLQWTFLSLGRNQPLSFWLFYEPTTKFSLLWEARAEDFLTLSTHFSIMYVLQKGNILSHRKIDPAEEQKKSLSQKPPWPELDFMAVLKLPGRKELGVLPGKPNGVCHKLLPSQMETVHIPVCHSPHHPLLFPDTKTVGQSPFFIVSAPTPLASFPCWACKVLSAANLRLSTHSHV